MILGGAWGAKNLKKAEKNGQVRELTNYEKIFTSMFVGAIVGASLPFSLPLILAEKSLRK